MNVHVFVFDGQLVSDVMFGAWQSENENGRRKKKLINTLRIKWTLN